MSSCTRWLHVPKSFQFKLFSIFTLLTFLIACLLCTLYIVTESRQSRHEVIQLLHLRTQNLADSVRLPLYAENLELLRQQAEQAVKAPEIRAVVISAPDGRVLVEIHTSDSSGNQSGLLSQTVEVHSSHLMDSVESSLTGHRDSTTALLGTVRMERGTADLSRDVSKIILLSVCMAAIFWLAVSLLCYIVLRRVTRSLNALIHGIDSMQKGDFGTRIEIETVDEPGRAAQAVNNLAEALQKRGEENTRLQEESLNLERQMHHAQKLESMGVMAGGIAHDFNNLLQSILGNMELAMMNLAPDTSPRKHVARAMESAKCAAQLTNLMLTYVGKGHITRKGLDLNELVRGNAEMLQTAASTAVSMEMHLAAELPVIMAGEAQIQQVVMNLITNAAESIEKQPGIIKLTTGVQNCDITCLGSSLLENKPEPGNFVFLEVSDNGCGMSTDTLKRLFDPFFTTKFTGRGLGMSAVMGIMKSHRGAMFVRSEPGKGTTMRVLFPIHKPGPAARAEDTEAPSPEKYAPPEKSLSGVALVVDDERSVQKVCAKMMKLCGFAVITACDGIEAVARYREHADEIVIVLMDLTMPNMDGITAMNEIYRIRPDARVILASGFNQEELGERFTGQAPSGFIRKPYSMNALESALRSVMPA